MISDAGLAEQVQEVKISQRETCNSLPASLWEALLLRNSLRASLLRQAHCRRTTRRRYNRKALRAWYRRQLR